MEQLKPDTREYKGQKMHGGWSVEIVWEREIIEITME